jgi:hypothetical protein
LIVVPHGHYASSDQIHPIGKILAMSRIISLERLQRAPNPTGFVFDLHEPVNILDTASCGELEQGTVPALIPLFR